MANRVQGRTPPEPESNTTEHLTFGLNLVKIIEPTLSCCEYLNVIEVTHCAMNTTDSRNDGGDISNLTDAVNRMNFQNDMGDDHRIGPDGEPAPRTDDEYAQAQLTLRAIVSSKEAGVIIGKQGKNVADLRDETGVKAGVSKVVQGVHDRVLTVTGALEGTSKAYAIVAKGLLEGAPQMGMGGAISNNGTHRK